MIRILPQSKGDILGVQASDKLSTSDYRDIWIPKLKEIITEHGKVRALLYLDETFQGWEPAAMLYDAQFGITHANDFDKIAIVGGPEWIEWAVKLLGHFIKGKIKTFPGGHLEDAWNWIK